MGKTARKVTKMENVTIFIKSIKEYNMWENAKRKALYMEKQQIHFVKNHKVYLFCFFCACKSVFLEVKLD